MTPDKKHEVFDNTGAKPGKLSIAIGAAAIVFGVALFGFSKMNSEQAEQGNSPASQSTGGGYWYSDAPIEGMTFSGFLGASPEDQSAVAAMYLSDTLWKDSLESDADHEALRAAAAQLITQTVLLVASDISIESDISDVFAQIVEKKENVALLAPSQ